MYVCTVRKKLNLAIFFLITFDLWDLNQLKFLKYL
jgi:hypothetical protein